MPFMRTLQTVTSVSNDCDLNFLDSIYVAKLPDGQKVVQFKEHDSKISIARVIEEYTELRSRLLLVHFDSLAEYLQKLRICALELNRVRERAMFVLSAAVSDFYIPYDELATHKVQSRDGPLSISFAQVPKLLGILRRSWAPDAFYVSFKLETDYKILIWKARRAIELYDMDIVVANELETRYRRVYLVSKTGERSIENMMDEEEIETPLVKAILEMYHSFILENLGRSGTK